MSRLERDRQTHINEENSRNYFEKLQINIINFFPECFQPKLKLTSKSKRIIDKSNIQREKFFRLKSEPSRGRGKKHLKPISKMKNKEENAKWGLIWYRSWERKKFLRFISVSVFTHPICSLVLDWTNVERGENRTKLFDSVLSLIELANDYDVAISTETEKTSW